MIRPTDIVLHLQQYLPRFTDLFSDSVTISSASVSGGNLLTVNATNHGLSVGNSVSVVDGMLQNNITTAALDASGDNVVFTTEVNHDLTLNENIRATLTGFTVTGYNTIHTLVDVPNRRNFTIALPSGETVAPTLTGNEFLVEDRTVGLLGVQTINTVPDSNSFTILYSDVPTFPNRPTQNLSIIKGTRISAAAGLGRAYQTYTKQAESLSTTFPYIYVVMGDLDVSKDRHTLNDFTAGFTIQDFNLLRKAQNFSIMAFIPTNRDVTAVDAQDLIYNDLYQALNRCLFLFRFTNIQSVIRYITIPDGHGPIEGEEGYNKSFYTHLYDYQIPLAVNYQLGFDQYEHVAFRDIAGTLYNNDNTDAPMTYNINLDDHPL